MPDVKHFDPEVALERAERLFWRDGTATASIQTVADATGLNRSSLYATFGGKQDLYRTALRRYLRERAQPALERLSGDERGLPAIRDFFDGLIDLRCTGEYAGWGCMIVNAQVGPENDDPEVKALLDEHHEQFCESLHSALDTAARRGQLATAVATTATAEALALLAYGVNVRSRAGADAAALRAMVASTFSLLERR